MGIILLPLLLGALCLLVPGTILGVKGVRFAPYKVLALLALVTLAVVFHALAFCAPFIGFSGRFVYPGQFLLFLLSVTVCATLFGGGRLANKFVALSDYRYAIGGSALYIAAGFIPLSWFLYGEYFQEYFSIKWIY